MTRRAFVIGNGPSLKETPLELLIGRDTWAVNKVRLIFPHTTWRPKFYVRTDDLNEDADQGWQDDIKEVLDAGAYGYFGPFFHYYLMDLEYPGSYCGLGPICGEHVGDGNRHTEWHPLEYCNFGGSLGVALQICARSHNYDEIYLVGCDMGYREGEISHFDPTYTDIGARVYSAETINRDKILAHEIAKKCSPIPIYNATIGGELEVYPRVDLYEVLNV